MVTQSLRHRRHFEPVRDQVDQQRVRSRRGHGRHPGRAVGLQQRP
jgi:hypothetical protein